MGFAGGANFFRAWRAVTPPTSALFALRLNSSRSSLLAQIDRIYLPSKLCFDFFQYPERDPQHFGYIDNLRASLR